MKLLIVRHAEAAPIGQMGATSDEMRPLTPLGREQASALVETLTRLGLVPPKIVTSSLVRAIQTAEPFLAGDTSRHMICEYLMPGEFRPKKLARFLQDQGTYVAAVGHNPDLSTFVAWLIGSELSAIELDKGAAALIEFDGEAEKGTGTLRWLITPEFVLKSS